MKILGKNILDNINNFEYSFYNDEFFTGKTGYSVTLILFGYYYDIPSYYKKGVEVIMDILSRVSLESKPEKEKLIFCSVLKFLVEEDLIEIDNSLISNILQNKNNLYKEKLTHHIEDGLLPMFLYLKDFEQDDRILYNYLILILSSKTDDLKKEEEKVSDLNFFFLMSVLIYYELIKDSFYKNLIKSKIKNITKILKKKENIIDFEKIKFIHLKLWALDVYTNEEFFEKFNHFYSSLALSEKVIYRLYFSSYFDLPYSDEEIQIIKRSKNMGLVNGKLALLYYNNDFLQKSRIKKLSFLLFYFV